LANVDAEHLKELVESCSPDEYLTGAFIWSATAEGVAFWTEISNDWTSHLEFVADQSTSCVGAHWLVPLVDWLGPVNATAFFNNLTYADELKHSKQSNLITCAFSWGDTDEGADFWARLDADWRKHVNKLTGDI
jgi:hypothetical protein